MPKGQSKMDNPEKLAAYGTQDDEKQNKNTTQYVGRHYKQPNTNNVNKSNYWRQRRTEHRFYAEIITDIIKRNSERKDAYM